MARTPEQKKLSQRKDAAYRFCKELAGLAGYEGTASGFDELLRDYSSGYLKIDISLTWAGLEVSESPEVE